MPEVHVTKDHLRAMSLRARVEGRPLDDVLAEDNETAKRLSEASGAAVVRHTKIVSTLEDADDLIAFLEHQGTTVPEEVRKFRDLLAEGGDATS
jgi:hypothetical protein